MAVGGSRLLAPSPWISALVYCDEYEKKGKTWSHSQIGTYCDIGMHQRACLPRFGAGNTPYDNSDLPSDLVAAVIFLEAKSFGMPSQSCHIPVADVLFWHGS